MRATWRCLSSTPVRALLALGLTALYAGASAHAEEIDLEGTWYVLVHYKDDHAPNPDLERWDDRVWVFERSGKRLRWTEYPIVVFDDETGRFERRSTGQYARILHWWEPDGGQLADIRDGLQVNSRGSTSETLRGSDLDGWSSGRASRAASASIVTYDEVWSVEGLPSQPVFRQADFMGSGEGGFEGATEYAATQVSNGVISGRFGRDGSRHGTFRMMRAGQVGEVKGATTQAELQRKHGREALERMMQQGLTEQDVFGEVVRDEETPAPGPLVPQPGLNLAEVVAAIRDSGGAGRKSALLRKQQVVQLSPAGVEEIPVEAVESGAFEPAPSASYGVIALQACRDAVGYNEYTSWYLLVGGSLTAWDHYDFAEQCAARNFFHPAMPERAALERQLLEQVHGAFPRNRQVRYFLYEKGLRYAQVGRLDDAERHLALGDESVDDIHPEMKSATTKVRRQLLNRSDTDAMRAELVEAIAAAKKTAGARVERPAAE